MWKKKIISQIERLGYVVVRRTPTERVTRLLSTMYPKDSGHELIRMGGSNDGGYLIPDDLDGIAACFSPGVDTSSAFELDCARRGMELYLADASVDEVGPELKGIPHAFEKKFIGVSNDPNYMTLESWVNRQQLQSNELLLQMDIEGAEYEALMNCSSDFLSRFRIICIELHHIGEWWNPRYFEVVSKALGQITRNHECVHIHPNNSATRTQYEGVELPNVMELTFLRKDRMKRAAFRTDFPHPLDEDCVTYKPTYVLPQAWFASN